MKKFLLSVQYLVTKQRLIILSDCAVNDLKECVRTSHNQPKCSFGRIYTTSSRKIVPQVYTWYSKPNWDRKN